MIQVKDIDGKTENLASNSKTNTALGLAIGALGTSIIGGGLNSLLNGGVFNPTNTAPATSAVNGECLVNKDMFYQTLLQQVNEQANRDISVERRFAAVESALATNAAVAACNRAAIQREFEVVDNRFAEEARYDELALRYAMCGTIKGDLSIPFNKLSMGVHDKTHIIDTYEARPFREPRGCNDGYGFGPSYGGF